MYAADVVVKPCYIGMAYIAMAYTVVAYIVMAYIVMAYTGMACTVMTYTVMADVVVKPCERCERRNADRRQAQTDPEGDLYSYGPT